MKREKYACMRRMKNPTIWWGAFKTQTSLVNLDKKRIVFQNCRGRGTARLCSTPQRAFPQWDVEIQMKQKGRKHVFPLPGGKNLSPSRGCACIDYFLHLHPSWKKNIFVFLIFLFSPPPVMRALPTSRDQPHHCGVGRVSLSSTCRFLSVALTSRTSGAEGSGSRSAQVLSQPGQRNWGGYGMSWLFMACCEVGGGGATVWASDTSIPKKKKKGERRPQKAQARRPKKKRVPGILRGPHWGRPNPTVPGRTSRLAAIGENTFSVWTKIMRCGEISAEVAIFAPKSQISQIGLKVYSNGGKLTQ